MKRLLVYVWIFCVSVFFPLMKAYPEKTQSLGTPVIIYFKLQPFSKIASEVRSQYESYILPVEDTIRNIQRKYIERSPSKVDRVISHPMSPEDQQKVKELGMKLRTLKGKMRTEIYERARSIIEADQNALASYIQSIGGKVSYRYVIVNAIAACVPQEKLPLIESRPEVDHISLDRKLEGQINTSTHSIIVDTFWNNGYTGGPYTGPWCAVVDCGIDWTHPALSSFTSYYDSVFHATAQYQNSYADNPNSTDDLQGHGTFIAGIIWSKGSTGWNDYKGVAYGDDHLINAKAGYRNTSGGASMYWSDAMAAVEWAINSTGVWADVINFSYGSTDGWYYDDTDFSRFWDAVSYDEGVVVSVAAGNDGPDSFRIEDPAISYNVITVGALYDADTPDRSDDGIPSYTSRGPTVGGRKKPDIVAPGGDSTFPITSTNWNWEYGSDFVDWSGTSFAAPHVAGALVLLGQALGYTPRPTEAKAIFINTADDWNTPGWDNATGWGYLNLAQAYLHRLDCFRNEIVSDTHTFNLYKGIMYQGDRATLVWQRPAYYNPDSFPSSYSNLKNLDLFLYRESDNTLLTSSESDTDNVEVVTENLTLDTVVIRVQLNLPQMWIPPYEERYSLATEEGFYSPSTNLFKESPFFVAGAKDTFEIKVSVDNSGGKRMALHENYLHLQLPQGFVLISGANPQYLGKIAVGDSATAFWLVQAPNVADSFYSFSLVDSSFSYGAKIASGVEGEIFVTSSTLQKSFSDNFKDCDISDWTVDTSQGSFYPVAYTYYTAPCGLMMYSQGEGYAYGITPDIPISTEEPYVINTYFMVPDTNNHWFLVLDNNQIHIVIDHKTQLTAWQGDYGGSKLIQDLNANQWYKITCYAKPYIDSYYVYINGVFKTSAHFFDTTGYSYIRMGDIHTGSVDYGSAYWDEITVFGSVESNIRETKKGLPKRFTMCEGLPNPFSDRTLIRYALPQGVKVELVVYNVVGRKVKTLVSGYETAGYKSVEWDATDDLGDRVGSGVYFVVLVAGEKSFVKKLLLLK